MVILDKIRLTGLLRKKPRKRGFFYTCHSPCRSRVSEVEELVDAEPAGQLTLKGFVKPVGAFRIVDAKSQLTHPAESRGQAAS